MTELRLMLVCLISLTGLAEGGDWPQFLGMNRTGTSTETGLLKTFPQDGPQVVWKTPLGTSMSGIAVAGKQALTLFQAVGFFVMTAGVLAIVISVATGHGATAGS